MTLLTLITSILGTGEYLRDDSAKHDTGLSGYVGRGEERGKLVWVGFQTFKSFTARVTRVMTKGDLGLP